MQTYRKIFKSALVYLKIVGGPRSQINVGHHGWPIEKILGFEWAKTTRLALKSLRFFPEHF